MKCIKDYKLFKKIVRKYWKRYATRSTFKYNGKKCTSYWTTKVWVSHICTPDEMISEDAYNKFIGFDIDRDTYNSIKFSLKNMIGKHVTASFKNNIINGIFNGVVLVNNGAFYGITKDNEPDISLITFAYTIKLS